MRQLRPGVASANRPRLGQFTTLLDQILHDDSALDGLAFAYGELPAAERRALVQAILQDAAEPTQALLALLAVEEDPGLQRRLARLIRENGRIDLSAFLDGDESEGQARLIQSLRGLPAEALHITWKARKIQSIEIESRDQQKKYGEAVPLSDALETLLPLLWQHMRAGGELPAGAERFAGFFSPA